MSRENVEVVRRLYELLAVLTAAGELLNLPSNPQALNLLDAEIEWHGTVGGLSEGVVARGHREVARFIVEDSQEWDELVFEPSELIDLGDTVLVLQRERRRGRHSGVRIETDTASVIWLRNGKVWRCQGYMDQAEALAAVGLRE